MAKRKTPEDQANEIVERLKEAIENPDRDDGKSGMMLSDWQKMARQEIAAAIRETQAMTSIRELASTSRLTRLMVRSGFMLLSASFAFIAFWGGIFLVAQNYGWLWGGAATVSAIGLAITFIVVGATLGEDE